MLQGVRKLLRMTQLESGRTGLETSSSNSRTHCLPTGRLRERSLLLGKRAEQSYNTHLAFRHPPPPIPGSLLLLASLLSPSAIQQLYSFNEIQQSPSHSMRFSWITLLPTWTWSPTPTPVALAVHPALLARADNMLIWPWCATPQMDTADSATGPSLGLPHSPRFHLGCLYSQSKVNPLEKGLLFSPGLSRGVLRCCIPWQNPSTVVVSLPLLPLPN